MNIYKLDVTERNWWSLDKDDYEQRTARRPPWYKVSDEGKPLYFAVCPACNNPIQIIGLYKLPPNITAPYAKHYIKPVPRVGIYDRDAYNWCPYSEHSKKIVVQKIKDQKVCLFFCCAIVIPVFIESSRTSPVARPAGSAAVAR